MRWFSFSLRLLRCLPPGDRHRLEPELATVLEDTESHGGVELRDAASIGSLVVRSWVVMGLRNPAAILSGILSATGVLLLVYVAFTAYQLDGWVSSSLPCEPSVLTDTHPRIDPAGYHLYTDGAVRASQAHDSCMADSLALLAAEGITDRAELLYWPQIVVLNVVAVGLALAAGVVHIVSRPARARPKATFLRIPATLGVAALGFQVVYAQTISVATLLVD